MLVAASAALAPDAAAAAVAAMVVAAAPTSALSSHGNETPVRGLLQTWLLKIVLPASAVAWKLSAGSFLYTVAAAWCFPLLAIAQGSWGIWRYRWNFGTAPFPCSPSHGVVRVHGSRSSAAANHDHTTPVHHPVRLQKTRSLPLSLGCQCGCDPRSPPPHQPPKRMDDDGTTATTNPSFGNTGRSARADGRRKSCSSLPSPEGGRATTAVAVDDPRRPIRVLLMGDSLAIGVGQARQCTPRLPEVLARTLSARLHGRVVYWTCHGSPGASTGWIVRELERGVAATTATPPSPPSHRLFHDSDTRDETARTSATSMSSSSNEVTHTISHRPVKPSVASTVVVTEETPSHCSDVDDDEDDETASSDEGLSSRMRRRMTPRRAEHKNGDADDEDVVAAAKRQRALWRQRLAQHRQRFDPQVWGPYDVVVVMTGSNDLKSAFFPFLLTGEDAEFRRQAQARGGNYTKELRRLLETLDRNMRLRLQNIRYSMEAATETVLEKVEETMERMIVSSSSSSSSPSSAVAKRKTNPMGSSFREKLDARKSPRQNNTAHEQQQQPSESDGTGSVTTSESSGEQQRSAAAEQKQFPLMVLPGLPARALPIFRIVPLRWLAVPIVDILDMHKRRLAKAHPHEVLFVPPPSVDDLAQYENCTGDVWNERCKEDPALVLRDIRKMDCRRIENELREYYDAKDKRVSTGEGLRKKKPAGKGWFSSLFSRSAAPGTSVFSVDQIHPNDDGYDFWGRYIGNAIADEWQLHPNRQPPE